MLGVIVNSHYVGQSQISVVILTPQCALGLWHTWMYTLTKAGVLSSLKRTLVFITNGVNIAAGITMKINSWFIYYNFVWIKACSLHDGKVHIHSDTWSIGSKLESFSKAAMLNMMLLHKNVLWCSSLNISRLNVNVTIFES